MKRNLLTPMLAVAIFLGFGLSPSAQASVLLYNTGVSSEGIPLGPSESDAHWSIIYGPDITEPISPVTLFEQNPFGLYAQSTGSRWIWANDSGLGPPDQFYGFRLTFYISSIAEASTLYITGDWTVDNEGGILLNGDVPSGTGVFELFSDNHGTFHSFSITSGFIVGTNTLDFNIVDRGFPGGFNVTNLSAHSSIPEPSTSVFLVGYGAFLLVFARRRLSRKEAEL